MTSVKEGYVLEFDTILAATNMTHNDKALLVKYLNLYTWDKAIQVSDSNMSKWLGVSEDTIQRSRNKLEELGYIHTKSISNSNGIRQPIIVQVVVDIISRDFGEYVLKKLGKPKYRGTSTTSSIINKDLSVVSSGTSSTGNCKSYNQSFQVKDKNNVKLCATDLENPNKNYIFDQNQLVQQLREQKRLRNGTEKID